MLEMEGIIEILTNAIGSLIDVVFAITIDKLPVIGSDPISEKLLVIIAMTMGAIFFSIYLKKKGFG